jgi:hypothetical protein
MVAGSWYNQDGLYLQYGTQKPVPEIGGDYQVYGELRVTEILVPLVPMQFTAAGLQVPAPPTTFSGTTTAQAAGITSLTTFFPLAQVAPVTAASSSLITVNAPQIWIESVEVDTMMAVTGSGSVTMNMGLATTSQLPGTPNASFVQITSSSLSSTGTQILNAFPLTSSGAATLQGGVGAKTYYTGQAGYTYSGAGDAVVATGGGGWVGQFSPLPSNAITPLPQSAWLSTVLSGALTSGLLKVRVKYVFFGNINY